MATFVTVPGAGDSHIVNPYNTPHNLQIAQQIAAVLAVDQADSKLFVQANSASLAPVPIGDTGEIAVTTSSGLVSVQSGYSFTAIGPTIQGGTAVPGPFTVAGGGSLFVGDQQTTYFGSAATATVSIAAGDGSDLIELPNGTNYVVGLGDGNDTVFANGSGTVTSGSGNNLFFESGGSNVVNSFGSADTIVAGQGSVLANTFGANPLVFGGSGRLVYIAGAGGDPTVTGGSGTETLFAGSGQNVVYTDGSNKTTDANILAAGAGNESLSAASANYGVQMAAGIGTVDMVGSKGNDIFYSGSGTASITGNGGSDALIVGNTVGHTGGMDIFTDFSSADNFVVVGYGANAAQLALDVATVSGGSTVVRLSDNTTITFLGVSDPANIHNQSF